MVASAVSFLILKAAIGFLALNSLQVSLIKFNKLTLLNARIMHLLGTRIAMVVNCAIHARAE